MDEKTEELRDIFIDATGADAVTQSQEETPGSLTDRDEDAAGDRLAELIGAMRDRYEFASPLQDAARERVVRGYFDDESDERIATDLGVDAGDVFDARMDHHLVDEADRDAPFDLDELKRLHVADASMEERAERLETDVEIARHFTEVVEADLESTRANDRFRDEFRELLTDADIEGPLAADARQDGLEEAAEDIETDVSF